MKKALLLATAVAVAAPQVFAQPGSFEGLSIGLHADNMRSTTESVNAGLSDSSTSGSGSLQLQYSFSLGGQYRLGLGLSGGTGSRNAGSFGGVDYSTKNAMSFDVLPGLALSDSILLYGRVSSLSATAVNTSAGTDTTTSISGIGWGLGLRAMVDKNVYLQVGLDTNRYDDKIDAGVTFKRNSNVGSIGIGYKF